MEGRATWNSCDAWGKQMKDLSNKKKIIYWIIFIAVFTAGPLLALEIAGRTYIHVKYGVAGKTYGLWRYDAELGAIHRENAYNSNAQTNNYGFRNREDVFDPKPPGTLRIITYGGSTTYCYNLANDEAWPLQLQAILRERTGRLHQVLNGGAILWSIGHAYARAKREISILKPDYVILYTGINESTNAQYLAKQGKSINKLVQLGRYGEFATNYDQNRWLKRNSVIVRFLDYYLKPYIYRAIKSRSRNLRKALYKAKPPRKPDKATLENYLHVLGQFIDLIRQNGGIPIFVIQARGNNDPTIVYLTSYSEAGAELARKENVIIVDARKMVRTYKGDPMDLFIASGVHYSKVGAHRLASYIAEHVFLDKVDRAP